VAAVSTEEIYHGYRLQLETYIKDHSDAVLSHGLCPDCAEKNFPDR
jgi:hypothetical protein